MENASRNITYAQAICEATDQAMQLDPSVIVIGQGTRDRGCIFGTVEGLFEKYGPSRVIEMSLSEPALAGITIGAALDGVRPVFILQRTDFAFLIMDELINHAAKWRYMFGGTGSVPITIRLITGRGWGQGPQHSQSLHATLAHFPGLRVVMPTQADDAKGLLLNAIFSDDPVVFLESRPIHAGTAPVVEAPYVRSFGKARILREGTDMTLIATSHFVPDALLAAERLLADGVSVEVIDPVSISPLDTETLIASGQKTKRVVVADVSWAPFGFASEVSALLSERLFGTLRAPVARVTLPWAPTPTAPVLEKAFYPNVETIIQTAKSVLKQ
ncbi:alpha-ketoacid dehydrogenase subunit beta [Patescibacteria group bacterium]|nr:alpha-ketoacid dehydrogenase subunit beta [Patescibacteria group bacterium]